MAEETRARIALVAGGSGLIGSHLLRELIASPVYTRVIGLSRRPLPIEHARFANRILRFADLAQELRGVTCEDAFCCLGTTRAEAGSIEAQRVVDHDLVLAFARFAREAGARQFLTVSSVGADPSSRSAYLAIKGETERGLEALRFPALHLFQPGLLLGRRRNARWLEELGGPVLRMFAPLMIGRWRDWRPIEAAAVAAAMRAAALVGRRGVFHYTNESILRQAAGGPSGPIRAPL